MYVVFSGPLGREAVLWAAVCYAGPRAALSHQTAAELHKITDRPSELIHVTIPADRRVDPAPDLVVHHSKRIEAATHPALPPAHPDGRDRAGSRCSGQDVRRRLRRGQRGLPASADYRGSGPGGAATASGALFDAATHCHRNRYLDNLYEEYGLCVELDGNQAHPEDQRWQDLRRINAITAEGVVTLRYGWIDVTSRPCETAAQIGAVLVGLGWTGPLKGPFSSGRGSSCRGSRGGLGRAGGRWRPGRR